MRKEFEEKFLFDKVTYRLSIEKKYDSLITYCTPYLSKPAFRTKAELNVLTAQYFIGNVAESDRLLKKKIASYDSYFSALNVLSEQNIALSNYFEIDSNRLPIIQYVMENYQKEYYPEKLNGEKIIQFFIKDQWSRRNAMNRSENTSLTPALFIEQYKVQNDELFQFYKTNSRLFSPQEVGKEVAEYQYVLLCHVVDLEERAFYLSLIKKAVKEGYCNVEHEVSFILRTESAENKDFFKTLDARIEELKKEYNLSYYSYVPF